MAEIELYDLITICPVCDGNKKRPAAHPLPTNAAPGGDDCPHCQGRGVVPTPSGRAVLEFLDHMRKS